MAKNRIQVEIDDMAPEILEAFEGYLTICGFEWKKVKHGPEFKPKQPKKKTTRRTSIQIPLDKKLQFIDGHPLLFSFLYKEFGDGLITSCRSGDVKRCSHYAKDELGYSQKSTPTDIVRNLYQIFLEHRHPEKE